MSPCNAYSSSNGQTYNLALAIYTLVPEALYILWASKNSSPIAQLLLMLCVSCMLS